MHSSRSGELGRARAPSVPTAPAMKRSLSDSKSSSSTSFSTSSCTPETMAATLAAHPSYIFLEPDANKPGNIWCKFCSSSFHGWDSHLKKHLATPTHQQRAAERQNRTITEFGERNPKPAGQSTLAPSVICKQDTLRHVLATGHSPSTIHNLLTPQFIAGLQLFGSELPQGGQLLRGYLDSTYESDVATIRALIGNLPFSLLVDETPEKHGQGLIGILVATPLDTYILAAQALPQGTTLTGSRLAERIASVVSTHSLSKDNFVAFIADNVSYGDTAFEHLLGNFPRLLKINCISHVLNLVSKDLTCQQLWPKVHDLLLSLKSFFVPRKSAESVGRQKRFSDFPAFSGRSAHSIFDFITTRWSEWLDVLHYILEHRLSLVEFVDLEADRYRGKIALKKRDNTQVKNQLLAKLADATLVVEKLRHHGIASELAVLAYLRLRCV